MARKKKSAESNESKVNFVDGIPVPIPPKGRQWLTPAELAIALEVKAKRIYDWISVGSVIPGGGRTRLACVRMGREIRIYPPAVLTYLRATSTPAIDLPSPVMSDSERQARKAAIEKDLIELGLI